MKTPREEIGPMKRALALVTIHREVVGTRTGRLALSVSKPMPRGSGERIAYSLIWMACKYGAVRLGRDHSGALAAAPARAKRMEGEVAVAALAARRREPERQSKLRRPEGVFMKKA